MWAEIVKQAATFHSAVISGLDAEGYPCSARCTPEPEHGAQVWRVTIGSGVEFQPGVANLLCHYHNDQLWDLRSLNVRGKLERDEQGWIFRPTAIVPELGGYSPLAMVKAVIHLRRVTSSHFKKRNLPRPAIPWDRLEAAKQEAIARSQ
jgi:hypothetical protein